LNKKTISLRKFVVYLLGMILCIYGGGPLIWLLLTAIKPSPEIFSYPPKIFPSYITFEHIRTLLTTTKFLIFLKNSAMVTGISIGLTLLISFPGAYVLARVKSKVVDLFSIIILMSYMFPEIIVATPLGILYRIIGISNTLLSLIFTYTAYCQPLALWLLRAYLASVPIEIEESALIDGATLPKLLLKILIPLSSPGLIAMSIFIFITAWNDYTFALILIYTESLKTLSLGLMDIYHASVMQWGVFMSMGLLSILPALAYFIWIQKYLIKGLVMGALKY